MALGLYTGNKVHLDMTSEGMLKVVGALLVLSGAMLFLQGGGLSKLQQSQGGKS